jgi:hypothetical protein
MRPENVKAGGSRKLPSVLHYPSILVVSNSKTGDV